MSHVGAVGDDDEIGGGFAVNVLIGNGTYERRRRERGVLIESDVFAVPICDGRESCGFATARGVHFSDVPCVGHIPDVG